MKPNTETGAPFVAPRSVVSVVGSRYILLADGVETNGDYAAFEILVPPGAGTPLHSHTNEEEVFYVVRGKLRFQTGDSIDEYGPGSLVHAAINVPHLFANAGTEESVVVVLARPAGIEKFFLEVGIKIDPAQVPLVPSQAEIDKVMTTAPEYGITVFPPTD